MENPVAPIYRPLSPVQFPSVQTSLSYYPQIVNRPASMPTLNRPTEKTLHTPLIDKPPPHEDNSFYHPPSNNTSKNWHFSKYRPTTKPPYSLVITHNGSYSSCVCSDNDNQDENEHLLNPNIDNKETFHGYGITQTPASLVPCIEIITAQEFTLTSPYRSLVTASGGVCDYIILPRPGVCSINLKINLISMVKMLNTCTSGYLDVMGTRICGSQYGKSGKIFFGSDRSSRSANPCLFVRLFLQLQLVSIFIW